MRTPRALAAVLLLGSLVAVGGPSAPAGADIMPGITLKAGQKVVVKSDSPLLMGKPFAFAGLGPADCDATVATLGSAEFCHSYAVTLDVPRERIKQGNLQLNVTLEWDNKAGVYVPNCPQIGNCGTNEMAVELWQDPPAQYYPDAGPIGLGECDAATDLPASPVKDEIFANPDLCGPPASAIDHATAESTGLYGTPDSPLSIAHIGAGLCAEQLEPDPENPVPTDGICPVEHVGVGNYTGTNPYTLTIELADFTDFQVVDRSIEDDFPVTDVDVPVTPDAVDPGVTTSAGDLGLDVPAFDGFAPASGAPRVDLPGLGSSAGFDGIGQVALGGELARKIVDRGPKALAPAGAADRLSLLLWLVVLPLGGIGSLLFLLWRRRREDSAAAV